MNDQLLTLVRYRNILEGLFEKVLQNTDLSMEQYLLMEKIYNKKEETPSNLACAMAVSRAAISRRCRLLGEQGIIERCNTDNFQGDNRNVHYRLTRKGKQLLFEIRINSSNLVTELESLFVTTNWDEIDQQLKSVSDALKKIYDVKEILIS